MAKTSIQAVGCNSMIYTGSSKIIGSWDNNMGCNYERLSMLLKIYTKFKLVIREGKAQDAELIILRCALVMF